MWYAILPVLGFAVGGGLAFALMYPAMRRAKEDQVRFQRLRRELDDEWDKLEAKRDKILNDNRRLDKRIEEYDRAVNALQWEQRSHEQQVAGFGTRQQEWTRQVEAEKERLSAAIRTQQQQLTAKERSLDNRVIAYDELVRENQFLKTEVKNLAVNAAFLEHLRQKDRAGHTSVAEQRDQLGRAYFDEVVTAAKKAMTVSNLPQNNQRVRTAAEWVRAEGVELAPSEEAKALDELFSLFQSAARAQKEREYQAQLRERMREEAQLVEERVAAEEAARQAERERATIAAALEQAIAQTKGQHAAEVDALRAQLAEAEAKAREADEKQRAISNAQLTKIGHVYVISNIGSFGEGVFKIGMTRRGEPKERIDELSSASVPFSFDVHMMIKCDDAPALENALHREFNTRRVNRVNPRKEFFRVTLDEIHSAVKRQRDIEYKITQYAIEAEAEDFRNSQLATDADVQEIEAAFASAGALNANPDEE